MTVTESSSLGAEQMPDDVLLEVENLVVEYGVGAQKVHAVSDVSLSVKRGQTLGLVGESGCGKSSLGRASMLLTKPDSGRVLFEGSDLNGVNHRDLKRLRSRMQMIFQDPISALNGRRRVKDIVAEGLRIHRRPRPWDGQVAEMLEAVGLDPRVVMERRPRELSGGQCQRVAIARALVLQPQLLVCDEPVSALDVSVQAQILNLLEDMKKRFALTMVFIAHDLAVVKNISDRIAVMYLGKICEIAESGDLYRSPAHPYTRMLIRSIPNPDPFAPETPVSINGDLPSPLDPPSGCRFRTRCEQATDICRTDEPVMREIAENHFVACHHPLLRPAESRVTASVNTRTAKAHNS